MKRIGSHSVPCQPRWLSAHFVALLTATLIITTHAQTPPIATPRPHTLSQHGVEWRDDYFWLRDREDPAVRTYLEAENAFTDAHLGTAALMALRDTLVEEMKSRIVDEDVSVPYRRGDWLYYSRTVAGADHSLICRRPFSESAAGEIEKGDAKEKATPTIHEDEQVMLDLNVRARSVPAYGFGRGAVSADGRLYAWKENHDGTDRYTVHFKDLDSGELLADEVPGTAFRAAPVWALDNRTVFYTEADDTERSWRVKKHVLGTPAASDVVVYEEADARFQVEIEATRSQRFLRIHCGSKDTTETSLLPLNDPDERPWVVAPRREGIRYAVADCEEEWFILSNEGAVNGRVFRAPLEKLILGRDYWFEALPGDDIIAYDWIDTFASHVVLGARKDGVPGVFFVVPSTSGVGIDADNVRWVTAPQAGASFDTEPTPEYRSTAQRISYQTFTDPYVVADVDLVSGELTVMKRKTVPAGYDAGRYRIEGTIATAGDGQSIPIWLLLPVDHPRDGSGGLMLTGYGAYGHAYDPWFDSDVFSLLDRGVAFGIAQVRGGGEFGRTWYQDGKLANKKHTFSDFISCAEHLIAEGYTSADQLCGYGASAGGLLAGAVVNERPDLFAGFVAEVPFVDVLNTMLDASIPLTTSEYDEWGNPSATRDEFDRIRAYSPYDNVKAQAYPAMLVQAGWNDTRVPYWEAAKWVARLRATRTDDNLLLLRTQFDTGHGGASGRYSHLDEIALQYAFVLKVLGREDDGR